MEEVFDGNFNPDSICILPPYPRLMGTFIPKSLIKRSFQLEKYDFTNLKIDSHTSIALQLISNMKSKKIMIIGYDGYKEEMLDERSQELVIENNKLFKDFIKTKNIQVESLFDTVYNLHINSIYSII
jgi:4-hydroxy 2-oxovalerate aldolase